MVVINTPASSHLMIIRREVIHDKTDKWMRVRTRTKRAAESVQTRRIELQNEMKSQRKVKDFAKNGRYITRSLPKFSMADTTYLVCAEDLPLNFMCNK